MYKISDTDSDPLIKETATSTLLVFLLKKTLLKPLFDFKCCCD